MDMTQQGTGLSLSFNPKESGSKRTFRATDDSTGGHIDGSYAVVDRQIYANFTYAKETADDETTSLGPNSHVIPDKNHITSARIGEVENLFLWFMDLVELRQADLVNQGLK